MPDAHTTGGWRLLRTTDGTADTDWVGTATAPSTDETAGMSYARTRDLGTPAKLAIVVVVLDASGDPLAPAGTFDLALVEILPRTDESADRLPILRASATGVDVGSVQTFELNGAKEWTIRTSAPDSLSGSLDSVEIWYRVERG